MSKLNREQAIKEVGLNAVVEVEGESVDFTNRVTGNDWVEFSATVNAQDAEGENVKLTMYLLVAQSELDVCEELDGVDWDKAVSEAEFQID
jgi:hypothetical protein